MKIFELRMMKEISSMLCEPRDVASVAWHPHIENMFVAGHQDGYMSYWIGPNPKPLAVVKNAHEQAIWSLDWHPAGHVLATGGCVRVCYSILLPKALLLIR